MRHKPSASYCGLTIVLSNPSRMDTVKLLTGYAGLIVEEALAPELSRWKCDIRTADTINEGLLPGTKVILLCGERSFHEWTRHQYKDYNIAEQRGCKLLHNPFDGIELICTFTPQDAADMVDWESQFNEASHYDESDGEQSGEEEDDKHKGKTKRGNYKFWIERDIDKCKRLLAGNLYNSPATHFNIYPTEDEIHNALRTTKAGALYLDIETDANLNITCFGFAFGSDLVFVVPVILHTYLPAYPCLGKIFQSLVIAMRDNETVCHNSLFDLFILAWKYGIPCGHKLYDTMLAHHRCWPEVEKSLGHCISHLLYEPYHKDEGVFQPQTSAQETQLWRYNGQDVRTTVLVRNELDKIAEKTRGLGDSIRQVNRSIRPDLINTLLGIRFNEEERDRIVRENDRLMMHYQRAITTLCGFPLLPSSPPQCIKYFHGMLGYKAVKFNKETKAISLDKNSIYKLKMAHPDNPVLDFILKYRKTQKETSTLRFTPWKEAIVEPSS